MVNDDCYEVHSMHTYVTVSALHRGNFAANHQISSWFMAVIRSGVVDTYLLYHLCRFHDDTSDGGLRTLQNILRFAAGIRVPNRGLGLT